MRNVRFELFKILYKTVLRLRGGVQGIHVFVNNVNFFRCFVQVLRNIRFELFKILNEPVLRLCRSVQGIHVFVNYVDFFRGFVQVLRNIRFELFKILNEPVLRLCRSVQGIHVLINYVNFFGGLRQIARKPRFKLLKRHISRIYLLTKVFDPGRKHRRLLGRTMHRLLKLGVVLFEINARNGFGKQHYPLRSLLQILVQLLFEGRQILSQKVGRICPRIQKRNIFINHVDLVGGLFKSRIRKRFDHFLYQIDGFGARVRGNLDILEIFLQNSRFGAVILVSSQNFFAQKFYFVLSRGFAQKLVQLLIQPRFQQIDFVS